MIITEKMIRELQRRVDVSYEEAEKFLKRAGGNIDIAESYAIRKENSIGARFFNELENIIDATLVYRLRIYKGEDVFTNIPVIVLVVLMVLIGVDKSLLIGVVFVVWALLADCNLKLDKVARETNFTFNRGSEKRSRQRAAQVAVRTERAQRKAKKQNYKKVRKNRKNQGKQDDISADIDVLDESNISDEDEYSSVADQGNFQGEVSTDIPKTIDIDQKDMENDGKTQRDQHHYQEGEYLPTEDDDDDYYEVTIEK